ncbi:serine hydrolase domain-containing protein [Couchioplanes azureus]|uniref:serine hydrolase domain-containing protein n=1 Tax=Couchioplanes caeruleus TaxID=56438 RepID=UPI001670BD51|nr:serine hydrolase domain-containing protein [Couchioplanes caeruleus]GGQ86004.1 serine hydrolase [Couchioplanes caeruleus subsp. azureus]
MTQSPVKTADSTAAKRQNLQRCLDRLVEVGAAGVQFRVTSGDEVFTARAGSAELGGTEPVPENGRFRIACITKMFVSTVVLQLVAEGKVVLDAPVETYLPGVLPYGDKVTVRNMLQHTSGVFNHADSFQRPGERFLRDRYKHYDAEELVAVAAARPLNFEPGTTFEYSNTNYIALGLLIRAVTGRTYAEEIRSRIIEPLELTDTYLPGDDPEIRGPHAHGYMQIKGRSEDVTLMNPSEACSSGEIISTAKDLDTFLVALVQGRILGPAEFAEMTHTVPPEWVKLPMSNGYGLGFMPLETSCGLSLWGHGGGIPGYATFVGSTLDGQKRVITSITLNIDPDDFGGTFENAVVDAINAAAECL